MLGSAGFAVKSTRPLASARKSLGNPSGAVSSVGSCVFVSCVGSIVNVRVTVFVSPPASVTVDGLTE
jgi:hypothetical protein